MKNCKQRHNFFTNRISSRWNALSNKIVETSSVKSLKRKLDNISNFSATPSNSSSLTSLSSTLLSLLSSSSSPTSLSSSSSSSSSTSPLSQSQTSLSPSTHRQRTASQGAIYCQPVRDSNRDLQSTNTNISFLLIKNMA